MGKAFALFHKAFTEIIAKHDDALQEKTQILQKQITMKQKEIDLEAGHVHKSEEVKEVVVMKPEKRKTKRFLHQ